jgi:archaellum component FlaD/FlaE
LKIGYNKVGSEIKNTIRNSLLGGAVGRSQVTPDLIRQWEAAGTPIAAGFKSQVNSGQVEPVVDENGIQTTSGRIDRNKVEERVNQIIEAINTHEEIFYLNLKHHDIIINPDMTVDMTVNFIAHGAAIQQMPESNLLDDPILGATLEANREEQDEIKEQLKASKQKEVPDNATPEQRAEISLENQARGRVENQLRSKLDNLREAYTNDVNIRNRKMFNQLRLANRSHGNISQGASSRIYVCSFPEDAVSIIQTALADSGSTTDPGVELPSEPDAPETNTEVEVRNVENLSAGTHDSDEDDVVIRNYARYSAAGVSEESMTNEQELLDENQEELDEDDQETMTNLAVGASGIDHGDRKFFQFVFLGDIVEAALEILAYNNRFTASSPPEPDPEPTSPSDPDEADEAEAEAAVQAAEAEAAAREANANYPVFFDEVAEQGRLGEGTQKMINKYGKYVFGDIELPSKEAVNKKTFVNIADIPIDLMLFKEFWFNEVVSRPNITRYYLKNLIDGLLHVVMPAALATYPGRDGGDESATTPRALMSYLTVQGDGTELNSQKSTRRMERYRAAPTPASPTPPAATPASSAPAPNPQQAVVEDAIESFVQGYQAVQERSPSLAQQMLDTLHTQNPGAWDQVQDSLNGVSFSETGVPEGNTSNMTYPDDTDTVISYNAESVSYVTNGQGVNYDIDILTDDELYEAGIMESTSVAGQYQSITADFISYSFVDYVTIGKVRRAIRQAQAKGKLNTYQVFLIHQKAEDEIRRTGNKSEDRAKGIYHFKLSSAVKKSIMSVQFRRSDLPGIEEANLMADKGGNRMGILRPKYDAEILLRGNCVFKVGTMLYLDPQSLQGPILEPDKDSNDRVQNSGIIKSAARSIGVGGYFGVSRIEHDFGSLGKGGKWRTSLSTRWNSFAYDASLPQCSTTRQARQIQAQNTVAPLVQTAIQQIQTENAQAVTQQAEDRRAKQVRASNLTYCFVSGTLITMYDGSYKPIEDITVGDLVLSYDADGLPVSGKVTEPLTHEIDAIVPLASLPGVKGDPLHPIYYKGEWISLEDHPKAKVSKGYVDKYYNLEVDGHTIHGSDHNFVINGYVFSGLGDDEALNSAFRRDVVWKMKKTA